MSARSRRVMELFTAAVERARPEREAYLAAMCGGDAALQREVEALLAAHSAAERAFPEAAPAPAPSASERAGDRVGPYKLLEVIGEGGFGVVWMAEQSAPIRRRVALKVLKAGMDTAQVVARFEAERQALALMDHPNIAKVLDAGATDSGRPYFAMELVRGVPITSFCDEARMSPQERLRLFVPVCEAVQHAHHKGVIHRDLKPSNVLVTLHDGKPVPKVIDFGIAKAISVQLTERTVFTGFRQMLGTPEYMAPEQAEMSGLDVDTRADVYSLGVVLYELLTGTKPFELKEVLEIGYQELLRRIREVDPEKPSTRVSTLGARSGEIAVRRRMLPKGLSSAFRGDLDWIVLKAMEKERGRRYGTALALAEDVERHLRDEPVLAGPPSHVYRVRKYVRRHRLAVGAAALIGLSLVGGAVASWMGYAEAKDQEHLAKLETGRANSESLAAVLARGEEQAQRERAERREQEAKTAAARAEKVIELLQRMLSSSNPHEHKGPEYTVRRLLDDFDRELGAQLEDDPEVEADVRGTLARSYIGLGLLAAAEPHVRRSLELRRQLFGEESLAFAWGLLDEGALLHGQGRYAEAAARYERVLGLMRSAGIGDGPDVTSVLLELLDLDVHQGRCAEAEQAAHEVRQAAERDGDYVKVARALDHLSHIATCTGRPAEAEALALEALAIHERLLGPRHPDLATKLINLAAMVHELGRTAEAEHLASRALDIHREVYGDQHRRLADTKLEVAFYMVERDPEAAKALAQEAAATLRATMGEGDAHMGSDILRGLWRVHTRLGDQAAAEAFAREWVALWRTRSGDGDAGLLNALEALSQSLESLDRLEDAIAARREMLELGRQANAHDSGDPAAVHLQLARLLARRGDLDEADASFREAAAAQRAAGSEAVVLGNTLLEWGAALLKSRTKPRFTEAETVLRKCVDVFLAVPAQEVSVARAKHHLGLALAAQGRASEAAPLFQAALDALSAKLGDGNAEVDANRCRLGAALGSLGRAQEAEPLLREHVAWSRAEPESAARALWELGSCLLLQGRATESEAAARESLEICRGLTSGASPTTALSKSLLGAALLAQGRLADAEPMLLEGVVELRLPLELARLGSEAEQRVVDLCWAWEAAGLPPPTPGVEPRLTALHRLGLILMPTRPADAEVVLRVALARRRACVPFDPQETSSMIASLARAHFLQGRHAEAEALARECLAIREQDQPGTWRYYNAKAILGEILAAQGEDEEAEGLLTEACTRMQPAPENLEFRRNALQALIDLHERRGSPERAAPWRTKLEQLGPLPDAQDARARR